MREVASEKESERARERKQATERERASERKGERATERQKKRARERMYTILYCRKLKDRSLYVQIYSDITRFHAKCQEECTVVDEPARGGRWIQKHC